MFLNLHIKYSKTYWAKDNMDTVLWRYVHDVLTLNVKCTEKNVFTFCIAFIGRGSNCKCIKYELNKK